ncbi:YcaO-like family protein [Saccharothrix australiensis]|uniref:Ribosomal protein S12 methylthiotransferase accessory factor n=1 Tax=Saccharothrix australiensis TaxID=2072 RepID=A0A495W280_9PSEU|nr:YcaO-like family protein [Saccharothrix australiensis]RKT55504.1 ribosomal protein S12 methylthiotransferase accessory factor [Saccharothrix australiensis]
MAEGRIVHRVGTYRTRTAEDTWRDVRPLLPLFAVTKVTDITRLDDLGFPTHLAYRATGPALAVSAGTGVTTAQSRVGAVMAAVETWHAEHPRLEVVERAPAGRLPLHYDVRRLNFPARSPLTPSAVVDWVAGEGLLSGSACLAPFAVIPPEDTGPPSWATTVFGATANGVACGNDPAEATLHALLEAVERDCLATDVRTRPPRCALVDPATVEDPATRDVVGALTGAGAPFRVYDITNDIGVPCFHALVRAAGRNAWFSGYGCHPDAGIALGRALLEAAQSRLLSASGLGDDLHLDRYRVEESTGEPRPGTGDRPRVPVRPSIPVPDDVAGAVRACARRVQRRTGVEPFVVDLTRRDIGIAVSKVFAPGLEFIDPRTMSELAR